MAIHSHPFGSVTLTGDDASAFLRQIGEPQPPFKVAQIPAEGVIKLRLEDGKYVRVKEMESEA